MQEAIKVGDLVQRVYPPGTLVARSSDIGTVLDFPKATHAKEFQKVKVMTCEGIQTWVMQFCKVVNAEEDDFCECCECTPCDCDWGME